MTFQVTVIYEALDNILSGSNQASFDSLQTMGKDSQSVLKNAETLGLYTALLLEEYPGRDQYFDFTGENMGRYILTLAPLLITLSYF